MTSRESDSASPRTAAVYNAASDRYDDPANSFWERYGRRTVTRIGLKPGSRVLDACCGSGASAIPSVEAVGPRGSVLGIDLAENLLRLARAKAAKRGLRNIEFRSGDLLDPTIAPAEFDAVVCVFGIFFIPDMPAAVRALWKRVRPGGKLAITTWGRDVFEPANTAFWDAVRAVRPELYKSFNPWDRIAEPETLLAVLEAGGVEMAEAVPEAGQHPVTSPEAWWATVLGTGYRGIVEQLAPLEREHVRSESHAFILRQGLVSIRSDVIYATATKS